MFRSLAAVGLAVTASIALSACDDFGPVALKSGDCFSNQTVTDGNGNSESRKVLTPCPQPHDGEAFLVFTMPGATFPGYFAIGDAQQDECHSAFKHYVGIDWEGFKYTINYESPDENIWATGNHQIVCILVSASNAKLFGSAKGTNQ